MSIGKILRWYSLIPKALYVYRKNIKAVFRNSEGIVCKNNVLTYNPFGIDHNSTLVSYKHIIPSALRTFLTSVSYKHIFPSGMGDTTNQCFILKGLYEKHLLFHRLSTQKDILLCVQFHNGLKSLNTLL